MSEKSFLCTEFDYSNMMKNLIAVLFLFLIGIDHTKGVAIELDAGVLRTFGGGAIVPTGGLLQLVATPAGANGTFGNPTPTSFVSGDNVVVASFEMNSNFGSGETDNLVRFNLTTVGGMASATTVDQGDALLLRWWPTLTLSSTAPGAGTHYGQYRSDSPEMRSNGTSVGIAWFAPAQTANLSSPNGLNFLTTDIPSGPPYGTNAPTAGYANLTVVPEANSLALVLTCSIGLIVFRRLMKLKN